MHRKLFPSSLVVFVLLTSCLVVGVEADSSVWSRTYGGPDWDRAYSVVETSDGGYAIAGTKADDFWLIKTDEFGNMEWNQTYERIGWQESLELVKAPDGGFAIAGTKADDFWLIKTDEFGNEEWSKTYGGTGDDYAYSLVATSDGGYAIAGATWSFGAGGDDFWLIKTDASGNMQWNQTYGGTDADAGRSVVETSDGGYAIAGHTYSFGAGNFDAWLIKTDASGVVEWNQTYGGHQTEEVHSLVMTSDGGYAIAGRTNVSWDIRDVKGDFYLVKTDGAGNMEWNRTYDIVHYDEVYSLVEASDGGYAIAGSCLVKTDEFGNKEWNKTFGGTYVSLAVTSDGGYVIAGEKDGDFLLIKTDEQGTGLDIVGPRFHIDSPQNKTYNTNDVPLNFTTNEETTWIGYSLDGQNNVTITGNTTLTGIADGKHRLLLYANDTSENTGASEELHFTVDTVPPTVSILTPENKTYSTSYIHLTFTVDEEPVWIQYSLDGQERITVTGTIVSKYLTDGSHRLTLYAEDPGGNSGVAETVYFTVDTTPPTVSILTPKNKTYTTDEILLNFTVDETCSEITYCLDEQENVTISGNTTISELPNGSHTITVYATDTSGKTGKSETVTFTITTEDETEPPPEESDITATAIAIAAAVATVCVLLFFIYRINRKEKTIN